MKFIYIVLAFFTFSGAPLYSMQFAKGVALKYLGIKQPEPVQGQKSQLDPKVEQDISEALVALNAVDVDSVLKHANTKKKINLQALAAASKAGLAKFKDLQTVLWATNAPTFKWKEDDSRYTYEFTDEYQRGGKQWDSSALKYRYEKAVLQEERYIDRKITIPLRMGIYKRDLIDGGIYAGNMIADYCLNKRMKAVRVDAIVDQILTHYKETEHFLRLYQLAFDTNEKLIMDTPGYEKLPSLTQAVLRQAVNIRMQTIFKKFVDDQYTCSSYNPIGGKFFINKKTLPIIAGKLLLTAATDYLEKKFVIPDYSHAMKQAAIAYEKGKDGTLVKTDFTDLTKWPPISPLWAIKLATHPKLFFQSAKRNLLAVTQDFKNLVAEEGAKIGSQLGIPLLVNNEGNPELPDIVKTLQMALPSMPLAKWLHNPTVQKMLGWTSDIALEGLSIKFFNDYCHIWWSAHITQYYPELIILLQQYAAIKEQSEPNEEQLKKIEKKIRKFVEEAHKPVWFLPVTHWYMQFLNDYSATNVVKQMSALPAVAGIAYSVFKWYRKK